MGDANGTLAAQPKRHALPDSSSSPNGVFCRERLELWCDTVVRLLALLSRAGRISSETARGHAKGEPIVTTWISRLHQRHRFRARRLGAASGTRSVRSRGIVSEQRVGRGGSRKHIHRACLGVERTKAATIAKARGSMRGGRRGAASRGRKAASASAKAVRKSKCRERSGRPKRALGAYMFFCKDQHAGISADNPNIPFGDVGRILGSRWQQMDDTHKKVLSWHPFLAVPSFNAFAHLFWPCAPNMSAPIPE